MDAVGVEEVLRILLDARTFNSPVMKFRTRAGEVDVVLEPSALAATSGCHLGRPRVEVFGIRIEAAALEDIIASKQDSGRSKDRLQLDILRQVA